MGWHLLRPLGRWSAIGHANGPPTAGMDQQAKGFHYKASTCLKPQQASKVLAV